VVFQLHGAWHSPITFPNIAPSGFPREHWAAVWVAHLELSPLPSRTITSLQTISHAVKLEERVYISTGNRI